jgi:hypothetical protein
MPSRRNQLLTSIARTRCQRRFQLPFGRGQRFGGAGKAANLLIGGFEYTLNAQYRTGVPVNLPEASI